MTITLKEFNLLPIDEARMVLTRCCGASRWVDQMLAGRPYDSTTALHQQSQSAAAFLEPADWIEAFKHHPQIGDLSSLREKYGNTKEWASQEQEGTAAASEEVLINLARCNQEYLQKFGYIFIICATGRSASEMLGVLKSRMENDPRQELMLAAEEQQKITTIRLNKTFV